MFVYRANLSRTLVLVAALFSAAAATGAFAREFRAADIQAKNDPTVQALRFIGCTVAERSGDPHQIRTFHSRRLGEKKETIEQGRAGAFNLDRTKMTPIGTFVPSINVLVTPFLFRSGEHLEEAPEGPIGKEILNSFDPYGLAFYDSGTRSVAALIERIRRVE
jgi:TRAP-type C4-dicarboxylate transport system substrate-binding protein